MSNTTARGLKKPLILAIIQALGWLYLQAVTQFLFYGGEGGNGDDLGLGTIVPGWLISIGWSWAVSEWLANKVAGRRSHLAFILGGIVALPLSIIIALLTNPFCQPHVKNDFGRFCAGVFHCLGLGLLPEGRASWAGAHALSFVAIALLSLIGFSISFASKHTEEGKDGV